MCTRPQGEGNLSLGAFRNCGLATALGRGGAGQHNTKILLDFTPIVRGARAA